MCIVRQVLRRADRACPARTTGAYNQPASSSEGTDDAHLAPCVVADCRGTRGVRHRARLHSGIAGAEEDKKPSLSLKANASRGLLAAARAPGGGRARAAPTTTTSSTVPGIEWAWGDGTESESSEDCEPYQAGVSTIKRRFSAEHVFRQAGNYRVFFRLKQKDKVVAAASANVQVRAGRPRRIWRLRISAACFRRQRRRARGRRDGGPAGPRPRAAPRRPAAPRRLAGLQRPRALRRRGARPARRRRRGRLARRCCCRSCSATRRPGASRRRCASTRTAARPRRASSSS